MKNEDAMMMILYVTLGLVIFIVLYNFFRRRMEMAAGDPPETIASATAKLTAAQDELAKATTPEAKDLKTNWVAEKRALLALTRTKLAAAAAKAAKPPVLATVTATASNVVTAQTAYNTAFTKATTEAKAALAARTAAAAAPKTTTPAAANTTSSTFKPWVESAVTTKEQAKSSCRKYGIKGSAGNDACIAKRKLLCGGSSQAKSC